MTPPILEPRVLDMQTRIGICTNVLLNTSFEEHMAYCRVPDRTPPDELAIVPTVTNDSEGWTWKIEMFGVFEDEFTAHRKNDFLTMMSRSRRSRLLPKYGVVRPEHRYDPWR